LPRRGQLNGTAGRENCTPEQVRLSDALRALYDPLTHATMEQNATLLFCTQSTLSQALGAHRVPDEQFVARLYDLAESASQAQGLPMPFQLADLMELRNDAAAAQMLARRGLTVPAAVAPVPLSAGDRRDGNTAARAASTLDWEGTAAISELTAAGRFSELASLLAHMSGAMSAAEVAGAAAALRLAELPDAAEMLLRGAGRRGHATALAVVDALARAGQHEDIPAVLAGADVTPPSREVLAK